jgi:hypothetical protein
MLRASLARALALKLPTLSFSLIIINPFRPAFHLFHLTPTL